MPASLAVVSKDKLGMLAGPFLLLLLQFPLSLGSLDMLSCINRMKPSLLKDGDLIVGVFFPLYLIEYNTDHQEFAIKPKALKELYFDR